MARGLIPIYCDRCGQNVETDDPSAMVFWIAAERRIETQSQSAADADANPLAEALTLLRMPRIELCQRCAIETLSAAPELVDVITGIALIEAERANLPADERVKLNARAELVRDRARAFRDSVRDRLNAAAAERAEGSP